jgi:uncharacterized PurR-regulated membrane protein YhhQ (DUF165 family)
MDWTILRPGLGTLAAFFGILLLALPLLRIAQGRLGFNDAAGLFMAGLGFIVLAAAALLFTGAEAQRAVVSGVLLVVAGNIFQRRVSRRG